MGECYCLLTLIALLTGGVVRGDAEGADVAGRRVLWLQKSGVPSADSHARLSTPFPALRNFTICYRVRLNRFREESTLLSYGISDDRDNEFRIDHQEKGYHITLQGHWASSNLSTPLRSWATFCFTYILPTASWTIYQDGKLHAQGSFTEYTTPFKAGGTFIIGQEQDSLGGGFQRDQSFSGEITDLNIWSTALTSAALSQVWWCGSDVEGDVVAWDTSSWVLGGEAAWVHYSLQQLCQPSPRSITIFPDRLSLHQATHLCQVVGGTILVPTSEQENSWLYQETQNVSSNCSGDIGAEYLWLGATDAAQEDHWTSLATGKPLSWMGPWRGDGPNGGTQENCLVMLSENFPGRWSDIACLDSYSFCVPCESPRSTTIYLRGPALCKYSPFNHRYLLGGLREGRPSLQGFFHSDIYWHNRTWRIQSLKHPEVVAWWQPVKVGLYPFGTHPWTLGADVCGWRVGSRVNLTLSACHQGEFTCADGSCIDLEGRCDLRMDCNDQSDEVGCSVVQVPAGYHSDIPPPPSDLTQLLHITLHLTIIAFPTIATQDLTFTASMILRWRDTRLQFRNLKADRSLNLLSHETVSEIWTPTVFFSNALGNLFSNFDLGARVECIRQGPSTLGPPDLPDEVNLFSGAENSLQMTQLYTASYNCDFDLIRFPFDSQLCRLRFSLVSAASSYMVLDPGDAAYTGPAYLIEYQIGDVKMYPTQDYHDDFASVDVEVIFVRRYNFYVLTLYVPTTLLILIAYSTFFFNPEDFNSRITVAITSLLVLTSLFTQTSNSLPKTSYFKLIDVWLFFCIVIIFLVILLQTLVNFSTQTHHATPHATPHGTSWLNAALTRFSSGVGRQGSHKNLMVMPQTLSSRHQNLSEGNHTQHHPTVTTLHTAVRHRETGISEGAEVPPMPRKSWDMGLQLGAKKEPEVNMGLLARSRVVVPVIFLIFNLCYWAVALNDSLPISGV